MAGTEAATREHQRRAALRAAADPIARERAVRVIRAALALGVLTLQDLADRPSGDAA